MVNYQSTFVNMTGPPDQRGLQCLWSNTRNAGRTTARRSGVAAWVRSIGTGKSLLRGGRFFVSSFLRFFVRLEASPRLTARIPRSLRSPPPSRAKGAGSFDQTLARRLGELRSVRGGASAWRRVDRGDRDWKVPPTGWAVGGLASKSLISRCRGSAVRRFCSGLIHQE